MTNPATPKASAGMSTMIIMSGSHALKPPDEAATGAVAPSAFSSVLTSSSGMKLVLQIDGGLKDVVARRDGLSVGLEAALCGDEVRKLGGQVHIGHFQ